MGPQKFSNFFKEDKREGMGPLNAPSTWCLHIIQPAPALPFRTCGCGGRTPSTCQRRSDIGPFHFVDCMLMHLLLSGQTTFRLPLLHVALSTLYIGFPWLHYNYILIFPWSNKSHFSIPIFHTSQFWMFIALNPMQL